MTAFRMRSRWFLKMILTASNCSTVIKLATNLFSVGSKMETCSWNSSRGRFSALQSTSLAQVWHISVSNATAYNLGSAIVDLSLATFSVAVCSVASLGRGRQIGQCHLRHVIVAVAAARSTLSKLVRSIPVALHIAWHLLCDNPGNIEVELAICYPSDR